jgi:hypothetical protein
LCFLDGKDIGQALGLWWFDQLDVRPGLVQHMGVEELSPVEVELDRAPGMRIEQIAKE